MASPILIKAVLEQALEEGDAIVSKAGEYVALLEAVHDRMCQLSSLLSRSSAGPWKNGEPPTTGEPFLVRLSSGVTQVCFWDREEIDGIPHIGWKVLGIGSWVEEGIESWAHIYPDPDEHFEREELSDLRGDN